MKQTTTIVTKAGTFEVTEKDGNTILCRNGKGYAKLVGVHPHDKDAIIEAIESNAKELKEYSSKVVKSTITPETIVPSLEHICDMVGTTIEDNKTKGFVTSRLKQVIKKLSA